MEVRTLPAGSVQLLDHVVIGTAAAGPTGLGFYSFKQAGII